MACVRRRRNHFGQWLRRHGISMIAAAEAIGKTRSYVHQLATGQARPGYDTSIAIKDWSAEVAPSDPILIESWRREI